MKKFIFISFALLIFISCSKRIEPIHYGEDVCSFCSMTIVDQTHSAQLVTQKGKNFKFDAAECMINYLQEHGNEGDMLHILSADYSNPGEMIDATDANFIISENIPSPMGAFLSVVSNREEAEKIVEESTGKIYDWKTIKDEISNQTDTYR